MACYLLRGPTGQDPENGQCAGGASENVDVLFSLLCWKLSSWLSPSSEHQQHNMGPDNRNQALWHSTQQRYNIQQRSEPTISAPTEYSEQDLWSACSIDERMAKEDFQALPSAQAWIALETRATQATGSHATSGKETVSKQKRPSRTLF